MPTAPAQDDRAREDAKLLVHAGLRDIAGAARFTGLSRTHIRGLVRRRLIWSFRRFKRRLIPVSELRRYMAAIVAEELAAEAAQEG